MVAHEEDSCVDSRLIRKDTHLINHMQLNPICVFPAAMVPIIQTNPTFSAHACVNCVHHLRSTSRSFGDWCHKNPRSWKVCSVNVKVNPSFVKTCFFEEH